MARLDKDTEHIAKIREFIMIQLNNAGLGTSISESGGITVSFTNLRGAKLPCVYAEITLDELEYQNENLIAD